MRALPARFITMEDQHKKNNPEIETEQKPEVSSELIDMRIDKLMDTLRTDPALQPIRSLVHALPQSQVFLVGGSIRDAVVGGDSKDYDFVVRGASVDQILKHCSHYGKAILAGEKRFAVIKLYPEGSDEEIDIALPRTEQSNGEGYKDFDIIPDQNLPIEEDLARRDFTFNAMALDVSTGKLIDPHNGKEDLLGGVVRFVGDPDKRLEEDLSRMLRGVRFAVKYNFEIEKRSAAAISRHAKRINEKTSEDEWKVAREKLGIELLKMIDAHPLRTLDYLDSSGLLEHAFPEFHRLKVVQQNPEYHPEGDVFTHTRMILENLPNDASLELKLSALFHDVGKYTALQMTYKKDGPHPYKKDTVVKAGERIDITDPEEFFSDGRYNPEIHKSQNIGHDNASVEILNELIDKLSLTVEYSPGEKIDWKRVRFNVQWHLLHGVAEMRESRIEKILFDKNREPRWDLVQLCNADAMTDDNSRAIAAKERIEHMLAIYEKRANEPDTTMNKGFFDALFKNAELRELGLKPGPVVHAIKEALRDEELSGRIQSTEDAISFIKAFLKTNTDVDWEERRYAANPEKLSDMRERRAKREARRKRKKERQKNK